MANEIDLDLPQSIKDKFESGEQLTPEETQAIKKLVDQLDVGDESFITPTPSVLELTDGTTVIKQRMTRIRTHFDTRVLWHGLDSTVQTRAVYKVLNVSVTVITAEQEKWAALLACIAGNTWLIAFLYSLSFGPVGWIIWAAAAVASTSFCFENIAPDEFKSFTGGDVTVDEERDEWG